MWDTLRFDCSAALRGLLTSRVSAALIIAALTLGLGANSAVFAVVNGSLDYAVWYRHRLHMFSSPENLAAFRAAPKTFAPVP